MGGKSCCPATTNCTRLFLSHIATIQCVAGIASPRSISPPIVHRWTSQRPAIFRLLSKRTSPWSGSLLGPVHGCLFCSNTPAEFVPADGNTTQQDDPAPGRMTPHCRERGVGNIPPRRTRDIDYRPKNRVHRHCILREPLTAGGVENGDMRGRQQSHPVQRWSNQQDPCPMKQVRGHGAPTERDPHPCVVCHRVKQCSWPP